MWRQYRRFMRGEQVLVAADTAPGNGDFCTAQFLSKTNNDVPLVYHAKDGVINMTNRLPAVLERIYDETGVKPIVTYEGNNGGEYEFRRLIGLNRNQKWICYQWPVYTTDSKGAQKITSYRDVWNTNASSRPEMLQQLQDLINKMILFIYDPWTIQELATFVVTNGKAQAAGGAHDDLVMALAIAVQLYLHADIKAQDSQPGETASVQRALSDLPPLELGY